MFVRYIFFTFIGFCLIFLLTVPKTVIAQKYPLELSVSQFGPDELKEHEGSVGIKTEHASIIIPLSPFDTIKLFLYLKEDRKTFTYKNLPDQITLQESEQTIDKADLPEKLTHSVRGLFLAFNLENSVWIFRRDQVIATDGKEVSEKDIGFVNQFFYRPKSSGPGEWSFGLNHSGGIAEDSYIPLIGYKYIKDNIHFDMVFPAYGYLQYRLSEHTYILWDETVEWDSYRMTEKAPWNNAISQFVGLTSRLEIGFRTSGGLEMGLSYGLTLYRLWTIKDEEGNELGNMDLKDTSAWSFNIQWLL